MEAEHRPRGPAAELVGISKRFGPTSRCGHPSFCRRRTSPRSPSWRRSSPSPPSARPWSSSPATSICRWTPPSGWWPTASRTSCGRALSDCRRRSPSGSV